MQSTCLHRAACRPCASPRARFCSKSLSSSSSLYLRTSGLRSHRQLNCRNSKRFPQQTRAASEPQIRSQEADVRLRSEAEAPWRVIRFTLYGTACISAALAFGFACTQLAAGLAHAPNSLPVKQSLEGIGIDVGAFGLFAFLLRRDLQARDKQLARLQREEKLGALQVELGNKKTLRLTQLRTFARVVVVAGTPGQVAESMRSAEQYREQLEERGLLIVPLPIFNTENDTVQPASQTDVPPEASATGGAADLKFKALPLRQNEWANWFESQLGTSKATQEKGLYLGLRMDGRVRTSGMGPAPWERFIAQIPPTSGMWQGLLDGLDGRV